MMNNVGLTDRFLRLFVAAVTLYLGTAVYGHTTLGWILDAVGAIAAFSGLLGFCGLYSLLGISTQKHDPHL